VLAFLPPSDRADGRADAGSDAVERVGISVERVCHAPLDAPAQREQRLALDFDRARVQEVAAATREESRRAGEN
jgi:hypothetical protein